jgi:hypothetical protein
MTPEQTTPKEERAIEYRCVKCDRVLSRPMWEQCPEGHTQTYFDVKDVPLVPASRLARAEAVLESVRNVGDRAAVQVVDAYFKERG